jgi:hypothetical protein
MILRMLSLLSSFLAIHYSVSQYLFNFLPLHPFGIFIDHSLRSLKLYFMSARRVTYLFLHLPICCPKCNKETKSRPFLYNIMINMSSVKDHNSGRKKAFEAAGEDILIGSYQGEVHIVMPSIFAWDGLQEL